MFTVKRVEPKVKTSAEKKIEQITDILFPRMKLEEEGDIKFHVDYSADSNLDAVLIDLEEGHNDAIAWKTLRDVSNRLVKVRKILEAYAEFDKDAQYIIVDNLQENVQDHIEAWDRHE